MRWTPLILALALVAVVPAPAAAGRCTTVHVEDGTPLTPRHASLGNARVCDSNRDGTPDTLRIQTSTVPSEGKVKVVQDRDRSPSGPDEELQAYTSFTLGVPYAPGAYNDVRVSDDGDDNQLDSVASEGGVFVSGPAGVTNHAYAYALGAWDSNGDGGVDRWGLTTCTNHFVGCASPGPRWAPDVGVDDVPEPVFKLPIVGWVP